jgi:hydroxymethylpyrimidine/phosphomethylpyrimidine kinase
VVLTIAGFDPSSGAGVTADLKTFAAHGHYGTACITALTVQSTLGVGAVEAVSAATVAATLEMLAEDVAFAGIKIGMLATAEICAEVAEFLESLPGVPVVLDPVLRSSSGRELLEPEGVALLRKRLLARADWITPNLDELSALTGWPVAGREDVPAAAERLRREAADLGNSRLHVLATGGHLERPEDYLLTPMGDGIWISGERVETTSTHGTGCALSSALLCRLVSGGSSLEQESEQCGVARVREVGFCSGRKPVWDCGLRSTNPACARDAAAGAKAYVTAALRAAYPVGGGRGPMHHLFRLDESLFKT